MQSATLYIYMRIYIYMKRVELLAASNATARDDPFGRWTTKENKRVSDKIYVQTIIP